MTVKTDDVVDVTMRLPKSVVDNLKDTFGHASNKKMLEDMLTAYIWMAEESKKGRVILTARADGADMTKLAMKSMEYARIVHGNGQSIPRRFLSRLLG